MLPDKNKNVMEGLDAKAGIPLVDTAEAGGMDVAFNFPKEAIPSSSEVSIGGAVASASSGDAISKDNLSKRQNLFDSNPSEQLMKTEITVCLKKELRVLKVTKNKLEKSAAKFSKGYAEVVAKIRELYRMMESLAYMTYDQLKNMWLKIVHNLV